jgi:two-component system cell cycle response regulator DivK
LASARQILALQGGAIEISSPPPGRDKGTQVLLRMPAAQPPLILVATQDEGSRGLLGRQLRARDYRVTEAPNGDGLFEALRREQVAVIMADLVMDDVGGVDLIATIKADSAWRRIPMISLTAEIADGNLRTVLRQFEIPVLGRPWREEDMLEKVYEVLVGRHLLG